MERDCEKNCMFLKALMRSNSYLAKINHEAIIAEKEGREFNGSVGSMCGSCVAIKKIKNAIDEKLLNEY